VSCLFWYENFWDWGKLDSNLLFEGCAFVGYMFLKASGFYCYATQSENFLNPALRRLCLRRLYVLESLWLLWIHHKEREHSDTQFQAKRIKPISIVSCLFWYENFWDWGKLDSNLLFEGCAFEGYMFLKASGFYCFTTKSENILTRSSKQNE